MNRQEAKSLLERFESMLEKKYKDNGMAAAYGSYQVLVTDYLAGTYSNKDAAEILENLISEFENEQKQSKP